MVYTFSDASEQVVAVLGFIKIMNASGDGEWITLEKSAKLQACKIFNEECGITAMVENFDIMRSKNIRSSSIH